MTTESSSRKHLEEDGSWERGHSLAHHLGDLVLHVLALHGGLPQAPLDSGGGVNDLSLGVAVLLLHVLAGVLQQRHHGRGEVGGVKEDLGVSLGLAPLPLSLHSGLSLGGGLSLNRLQPTLLDSDGLHINMRTASY